MKVSGLGESRSSPPAREGERNVPKGCSWLLMIVRRSPGVRSGRSLGVYLTLGEEFSLSSTLVLITFGDLKKSLGEQAKS